MPLKIQMASVPYSGTANSANLVKVCKSYAKNVIFCMKLPLSTAISRNGSDYFQNPFFDLFSDMKATSVLNFKSIRPSLRKYGQNSRLMV
jgi:hypothetical protein